VDDGVTRVRCRCCGEEVHPDHPLCCGAWDDVEEIPAEELSLYEHDLPVDLRGYPLTGVED